MGKTLLRLLVVGTVALAALGILNYSPKNSPPRTEPNQTQPIRNYFPEDPNKPNILFGLPENVLSGDLTGYETGIPEALSTSRPFSEPATQPTTSPITRSSGGLLDFSLDGVFLETVGREIGGSFNKMTPFQRFYLTILDRTSILSRVTQPTTRPATRPYVEPTTRPASK